MKLLHLGALAIALALPACYDFHQVGPEDPPALPLPATVSVSVVYIQPSACLNTSTTCGGPVTFQASWLPINTKIDLQQTAFHTWTTVVTGVPINYPGTNPYYVYAVDPFLADTATGGVSAHERLTIGGEKITTTVNGGGRSEQGLIYIDANGRGRSPQ